MDLLGEVFLEQRRLGLSWRLDRREHFRPTSKMAAFPVYRKTARCGTGFGFGEERHEHKQIIRFRDVSVFDD